LLGNCTNDGKCACNPNWTGTLCDKCEVTFYGPQCLPLPGIFIHYPNKIEWQKKKCNGFYLALLSIAPTSGMDVGGTIVTAFGHNFANESGVTWHCRFGNNAVLGKIIYAGKFTLFWRLAIAYISMFSQKKM
jgi:hypothetical protein